MSRLTRRLADRVARALWPLAIPVALIWAFWEEGGATATEAPPTPDSDDTPAEDPLGSAGEKALREERAARKAAEREAKAAAAELAKLREATASEAEKAVAKAREEGKAEALKLANARLLRAEIMAAAAGKLADPADAVRLLDSDEFSGSDGEVDAKALARALDDLLKAKPYLAAKGARPSGDGGNGVRGRTAGPTMDDWIRRQSGR